VPFVGGSGVAALALITVGLVEAERDAVGDVVPVLLLDAAQDERESG
jgi:hypothetical protein